MSPTRAGVHGRTHARAINRPDPRLGTGGSYSTKISGHDFIAEGITFENTAGDTGQALAIYADADRLVFRKCGFLGWQDTIYYLGMKDCHGGKQQIG